MLYMYALYVDNWITPTRLRYDEFYTNTIRIYISLYVVPIQLVLKVQRWQKIGPKFRKKNNCAFVIIKVVSNIK